MKTKPYRHEGYEGNHSSYVSNKLRICSAYDIN